MVVTRCPNCVGRKTLIAPGGMLKDCPNCKGVGYVRAEVEDKAMGVSNSVLGESGSEEVVPVKRKKRVAKTVEELGETRVIIKKRKQRKARASDDQEKECRG